VDQPRFAEQRVTRYGLPPERISEARRVARPVGRVILHPANAQSSWPAGPPQAEIRGSDGGQVRPVHVAPPARGRVERVIVRPHPRTR
jgi:hypothetical protein